MCLNVYFEFPDWKQNGFRIFTSDADDRGNAGSIVLPKSMIFDTTER